MCVYGHEENKESMLKFFQRIRRKLIDEGNLKKYLLYAIGEILLVVIGILIALQINNWNEYKKDRITESKLLIELKENLEINAARLRSDIQKEQKSIESINFVVDHLDSRRPYHDSLDVYFKHAFFSPDIVLSSSGFESIKAKGFTIVINEELRKAIKDLFDVTYDNMLSETIRLEDQFWPSSVLPVIHKHFRTSDLGSKPVDYENLLDDASYTNMILNRKNFRNLAFILKSEALNHTESLLRLIESELKERE
jgi:hypothetical protein